MILYHTPGALAIDCPRQYNGGMKLQYTKPRPLAVYLFCLACAAAILMFCSKSSFLYPFNDWEDANILFTMGRGMMQGRVPYRDLYDQKGPLSFFLYGLASLITSRSYTGLYILETLSISGFLYFSYRIITLYEERNAIFCLPPLGALVASAMSFAHGGSIEELSLAALAFSFYDILRHCKKEYPTPMPLWRLLAHGALAGCLLWMKYTMLGFYIAWIAMLFIALLIGKQIGRAFLSCLVFLCGMALAALPWLAYFWKNGALDDLFRYYFLYNIFDYSGEAPRSVFAVLLNIGKDTLATFRRNPQYSLLIALGVFWLSFARGAKAKPLEKWTVWALCVLSCAGIYIGTLGYRYYGVVLTVFACLGAVPLLRLYNRYAAPSLTGRKRAAFAAAAVCVLSIALCPLLSDNAYMLGQAREDLPQYQFAALMRERAKEMPPTLLSYQMMDFGFYMTLGYEPDFRYFSRLNIAGDEIRAEQTRYLDEGLTEFVVTRQTPLTHENYDFVAQSAYYYEGAIQTFYLYQRGS